MEMFDLEKMGVVLSILFLVVASAVVTFIALFYLFVRQVDGEIDKHAVADYNERVLGQYRPILSLLLLKLTRLTPIEIADVVNKLIRKGDVRISTKADVLVINNEKFPIESSENDPANVMAAEAIFKELADSSESLRYWHQSNCANKQYSRKTPQEIHQTILGICYAKLTENRHFIMALDKFGLNISKLGANKTTVCRTLIRVVEVTQLPERFYDLDTNDDNLEIKEHRIRRWQTAS